MRVIKTVNLTDDVVVVIEKMQRDKFNFSRWICESFRKEFMSDKK